MINSVTISPDIKHERTRIDINGNEIDPKTKKIIKPNEPPYVPTQDEIEGKKKLQEKSEAGEASPKPQSSPNGLAEMIKKMVNEAVVDSLKNIDIKSMVQEAIQEAFKQ